MQLWNRCNADDRQTRSEERVSLSGFYSPSGGGGNNSSSSSSSEYSISLSPWRSSDLSASGYFLYLIHGKSATCLRFHSQRDARENLLGRTRFLLAHECLSLTDWYVSECYKHWFALANKQASRKHLNTSIRWTDTEIKYFIIAFHIFGIDTCQRYHRNNFQLWR